MTAALKEWQWIQDNPLTKVKKFKEFPGRVRFLDEVERKALIQACKVSQCKGLYLVFLMSLATGARRMEIWGLKWSDVDIKTGRLIFRDTKNKETRVINLYGQALDLLRKKAKKKGKKSELLFPSSDPKKIYDSRRYFDIALEKAGITNFH